MKPDQIDILAFSVLGDLEQINEAEETGSSRQLWSDLGKADRLDRIYFDVTFFHAIALAHSHAWAHPDPDAACDFAATHAVAKAFGEDHLLR